MSILIDTNGDSVVDVNNNITHVAGTGGLEERTVSRVLPRVFVLRGIATGTQSGASVSTRMAGDAATLNAVATLMTSAATVEADTLNDDFIWSDMHNGAHASTTADWTNGYLVNGLNSTSSTAEVLSK